MMTLKNPECAHSNLLEPTHVAENWGFVIHKRCNYIHFGLKKKSELVGYTSVHSGYFKGREMGEITIGTMHSVTYEL